MPSVTTYESTEPELVNWQNMDIVFHELLRPVICWSVTIPKFPKWSQEVYQFLVSSSLFFLQSLEHDFPFMCFFNPFARGLELTGLKPTMCSSTSYTFLIFCIFMFNI